MPDEANKLPHLFASEMHELQAETGPEKAIESGDLSSQRFKSARVAALH